jgi:hypothetical protein
LLWLVLLLKPFLPLVLWLSVCSLYLIHLYNYCEFIDLLIYRCKALDSVFHCLPESANILDPTEASDVKILKKVGLCVDEQFYYNTKN